MVMSEQSLVSKDKITQNLGLLLSAVALACPWILEITLSGYSPPALFDTTGNWALYPPFYWLSMLLLIAGVIHRRILKVRPYKFAWLILLFSLQAFLGFHPLTPYPFFSIIVFAIGYKVFVERWNKKKGTG